MQLITGINNFTLQIEYLFLHLNTIHTKTGCKNVVFISYKVNENTSCVNLYFTILKQRKGVLSEAIVKPMVVMDCVELVLESSEDGQMSLVEQKRLPGENNVSSAIQ